ncbi:MAG: histone deacetylase, partial [Acidiferrobacterales bacterium]
MRAVRSLRPSWFFSLPLAFTVALATESSTRAEPGATGLVYHPDYLLHDAGPRHPERPERLKALMAHLEDVGLLTRLTSIEPRTAADRWITQVHSQGYLDELGEAVRNAPTQLDPDTRVSSESLRVAKLATGGVLAAIDAVMAGRIQNAFVAARPPGHHALRDRAMGFCLINHVAVAVRYVRERYGLERVLIVDWDVHHGNGTQAIFYEDPGVLYFSTHQYPFYPGTGQVSETGAGEGLNTTINVPLRAGAGDEEVIRAFEERLLPVADAFAPQFVLISAGFDAHRDDPLAHLVVTE